MHRTTEFIAALIGNVQKGKIYTQVDQQLPGSLGNGAIGGKWGMMDNG